MMVYMSEFIVGRWYDHLLRSQSALPLKSRLFFTPP
jgi:hypothetical protein